MILKVVFVVIFASLDIIAGEGGLYSEHIYRYDYEYSREAEGWLKYHLIPSAWEEARFQCHAEGAVLFSPLTDRLKSAVVTFVQNKLNSIQSGTTTVFTGVHATYAKGVYNSIEGVPLLKLAVTWAPGEPDNYENSESCLVMKIDCNGTMADVRCDSVLPYVCYRQLEPNVNTTPDCGTIDPEYVYEKETGSCYKYHTKVMSWSDAYRTCDAEGGYLAIINTEAEAKIVTDILKRKIEHGDFKAKYDGNVHIGYHDWGHLHNFMTIHGKSLHETGYQKWSNGQPNNASNAETHDYGQLCGGVSKDSPFIQLNNLHCNLPYPFLCEMIPHNLKLNYFVLD